MPDSELFKKVQEAGDACLKWIRRAWEPYPTITDPGLQRQLVLRAARECGGDERAKLFNTQPTFAELDKEMQDDLWMVVLLFWTLLPLLALAEVVPFWRVRCAVIANWERWLAEADPECRVSVLHGDVNRALLALPRKQRKQLKGLRREAQEVYRHWEEFREKLATVRQSLEASEADVSRESTLQARLANETDPITRASLERQLQALRGQQQAREALIRWRGRLEASRDECEQALSHLHSRLTLLATTSASSVAAVDGGATEELHRINATLSATQEASEEVLQLRAR